MTTGREFRPRCAKRCSSRSSGSTMRATRMRAAPGSALRLPATSRGHMAATSPLATARWAACAPRCACRCDELRRAGAHFALVVRLRQQCLQLLGILDVDLEPPGHHDVAGLLAFLAGTQPLGVDLGRDLAQ